MVDLGTFRSWIAEPVGVGTAFEVHSHAIYNVMYVVLGER